MCLNSFKLHIILFNVTPLPFIRVTSMALRQSYTNNAGFVHMGKSCMLLNVYFTHLLWTNGRHYAYDIFRCIFVNETFCILIKISLTFVPYGPIDNKPASVQIMAGRRIGDKPVQNQCWPDLLTHICKTSRRWVKGWAKSGGVSSLRYMIDIVLFRRYNR